MKGTKFSHALGALASLLILSAPAKTLAGDGDNTGTPTNVSCCGQTAVAIQTCVTCDPALTTTELLLRAKAVAPAEAAARKPRHTVTAFGFVIAGNKDAEKPEWLDRDAAAFSEIQSSGSWARADAERQPRGLRLFSWSW